MNGNRPRTEPALDELEALPVLATRVVDGRQIQFELIPDRPAFRLTFTDRYPHLLGHATGMDTPTPAMIPTALYNSWATAPEIQETILDIATFTWHHRVRLLEEAD